jgi:hypothetical protein
LVRQVFTSSTETQKEFKPSRLQRIDGGYIVENSEGELLWLDKDYGVRGKEHLVDITDHSSFVSKSITSWIKSGNEIIAFGS